MIDVIDKQGQDIDPENLEGDERQRKRAPAYVYCATCSHVLATAEDRMEVNGSHEHFCTNPHGFDFHLGCFAQALGCNIVGERHAADSWFPGFQWRLATCGQCNAHLGWYFDDETARFFYGLIFDRIQTE